MEVTTDHIFCVNRRKLADELHVFFRLEALAMTDWESDAEDHSLLPVIFPGI